MPKIQISEKGQRNEAIKVEYIISFHIALITFINSDKIISAVSVLHRFDYFHSLHIIHMRCVIYGIFYCTGVWKCTWKFVINYAAYCNVLMLWNVIFCDLKITIKIGYFSSVRYTTNDGCNDSSWKEKYWLSAQLHGGVFGLEILLS